MDEGHENMHPMVSDIKIEDEEFNAEPNAKDRTPERDRSESRRGIRVPKRKKFEWQDEPTVFLIEFIKAHPSIWDNTDVMYRNVRMNKNLFVELVNVLSTKYPEHGYTYEIVRRKWDSLKGYYSRKAQRSTFDVKDPKAPNGNTPNDDDASDLVHWAYFERLSFLANTVTRINASEAGSDEENESDYVQSEPLNLEFSSFYNATQNTTATKTSNNHTKQEGSTGKRRKYTDKNKSDDTSTVASIENGDTQLTALPLCLTTPVTLDKFENANTTSTTNNHPSSNNAQTSPSHHNQPPPSTTTTTNNQATNSTTSQLKTDPDEFGIGKYVGKVLQDLDADLTDELVSRVVRDCIEVRHKQRLRFAEQFQNCQ